MTTKSIAPVKGQFILVLSRFSPVYLFLDAYKQFAIMGWLQGKNQYFHTEFHPEFTCKKYLS